MNRISTSGVAEKNGLYFVALRKPGTSIGESWEFPGGKCEAGETPEQALKREFLEEFNLNVEVGRKIFSGTFSNGSVTYTQLVYEVEMLSGDLQLEEHSGSAWMSLHELENVKMADSDRQILSALRCTWEMESR